MQKKTLRFARLAAECRDTTACPPRHRSACSGAPSPLALGRISVPKSQPISIVVRYTDDRTSRTLYCCTPCHSSHVYIFADLTRCRGTNCCRSTPSGRVVYASLHLLCARSCCCSCIACTARDMLSEWEHAAYTKRLAIGEKPTLPFLGRAASKQPGKWPQYLHA